jgi:hypothetical protein
MGASTQAWPSLLVDEWTATRDTLHMWTQIVGKVRMGHLPLINHWWQVTLYLSARGLTTGGIPYRDAVFDIEFDFVDSVLAIRHSDGSRRSVPLEAKPVAAFYRETLAALDSLGIESHIVAHPNEVDPMRRACSGSSLCRHTGCSPTFGRGLWARSVQCISTGVQWISRAHGFPGERHRNIREVPRIARSG